VSSAGKRLLQEGVSSAGGEFEGERICVSSAGEIRLQGCGHQAPQCRELAGDSSRTCCCPDGDHNKMSKSRGSLRSTK